jgi:hypothetical protein
MGARLQIVRGIVQARLEASSQYLLENPDIWFETILPLQIYRKAASSFSHQRRCSAGLAPELHPIRRDGRVVMQRPAKPCTPVRFRLPPPITRALSSFEKDESAG